jgi:hypothetical protein
MITIFNLEDVFVTEGVPAFTFVKPPNYTALLVDIRREGKPVIIEGQSGAGKTTTVKKVLSEIYPENTPRILTPRNPHDLPIIEGISLESGNKIFVIDDFHRLKNVTKEKIADISKLVAEREERSDLPKIIIVGINEVGADLIQLVPDIAKRIGVHRISPGTHDVIKEIIKLGSSKLNIEITNHEEIINDSRGDYWLTQQICKTICISTNISQSQDALISISWNLSKIRELIVTNLRHNYDPPVKDFCRGRRFRPSNDPYFKLLKAVSEQEQSTVDLNELSNSRADIKGSINNIKDHRLSVLLEKKESCSRLFYYDSITKNFALEDPALFYYLKNLNWDELRQRCGFRDGVKDFDYDIAISFAGENRKLARFIVDQLAELDISTFYDRNYEDNFLGGLWAQTFKEVFAERSRLVVAILDIHHYDKVWPTFERDCFAVRVKNSEVIPIKLDDTVFVGFPKDLVSIILKFDGDIEENKDMLIDDVVLRIATKLDNL